MPFNRLYPRAPFFSLDESRRTAKWCTIRNVIGRVGNFLLAQFFPLLLVCRNIFDINWYFRFGIYPMQEFYFPCRIFFSLFPTFTTTFPKVVPKLKTPFFSYYTHPFFSLNTDKTNFKNAVHLSTPAPFLNNLRAFICIWTMSFFNLDDGQTSKDAVQPFIHHHLISSTQ